MQHDDDGRIELEDAPGDDGHGGGGALRDRVAHLEAELQAANSRATRALADFQNYQRRSLLNEIAARQQGVSAVAMNVIGALDHFEIALKSTDPSGSADQVLAGVRVIHEELLRGLAKHGVSQVAPQPNDEFVPGIHEALMQQPREGVEPGRIVETFQPGFVLREGDQERVLRPAKVVVAPGAG